jgi:hypothetical protein
MADKNLIGGKYTVYLHLLQIFGQKNAFLRSFYLILDNSSTEMITFT